MLATTPTESCATPLPMDDARVARYTEMYRRGVWRSRLLHDMIMDDVTHARSLDRSQNLTMLDIGCGNAFDDDAPLQRSLASSSDKYLGVEPDPAIHVQDCFTEVHRNTLEMAPIALSTVAMITAW